MKHSAGNLSYKVFIWLNAELGEDMTSSLNTWTCLCKQCRPRSGVVWSGFTLFAFPSLPFHTYLIVNICLNFINIT